MPRQKRQSVVLLFLAILMLRSKLSEAEAGKFTRRLPERRRIQSVKGSKNSKKGGVGVLRSHATGPMKKSTTSSKSMHDKLKRKESLESLKSMARNVRKKKSSSGKRKSSSSSNTFKSSKGTKNSYKGAAPEDVRATINIIEKGTFVPDENASGGTILTIIDENDPYGVFDCETAYNLDVGESVITEPDADISHVPDCAGGFTSEDFDGGVRGSWFNIEGTGGVLMATSCPAQISVYEGDDCADLSCARSVVNEAGCQVEWITIRNKLYRILVQSQTTFEENHGSSVLDPIQVIVQEIEEAPSIDGVGGDLMLSEDASGDVDFTLDACRNATEIIIDSQVAGANFQFPLDEDFETCEHDNWPTNRVGVKGAWFQVTGQGNLLLRANACPFQISVYQGDCSRLRCADGSYSADPLGCEFEWRSSHNGVNYLLVQSTVAGFLEEGTFDISVVSVTETPSPTRTTTTEPTVQTSAPTEEPTNAVDTVSPTISPLTPAPISTPSFSPTNPPQTPEPTASTEPPSPSPSVSPTGTSTSIAPTTIPTSSSDAPSFAPTLIDGDGGDGFSIQQCRNNSIPVEIDEPVESMFNFPLSKDFAPCEIEISPTERTPIRGTWFTVAGNGTALQVNACPYQLSVYSGECGNLTCLEGQYSDARGCEFDWIMPETGFSYILVQSTIAGFPEVGNISFTLSVVETQADTLSPTTLSISPTTEEPTAQPSTPSVTSSPTLQPATSAPTDDGGESLPTTPTIQPTTQLPTPSPITSSPTFNPTTAPQTDSPTTLSPTFNPTTSSPTLSPSTSSPSGTPTTVSPTFNPSTSTPTGTPTDTITTLAPTNTETTLSPSESPVTASPTFPETTLSPTFVPTAVTVMPTSAPDQNVSPPPTLVGPINDLCTGAFPLSLGESMEVSTIGANPEPRGLDTCDRRDVESMNTTRRSVWYSIAAESASSSSRRYRLDACNSTNSDIAPVHLTLYESNNNDCDILVCAVTLNNLGCTLEWDVLPSSSRQVLTSSRQVLTTTYKVLVEQIVPTNNTDIVAPFNISFSVANVPANDDCLRAETVQVGDIFNATALSATPETLETITTCERDNGDIFQHIANRDPIPGVWYRVVAGGRVRLLASACNSRRNDLVHVTVYTGSCLDLECLTDSSLSPRSCESVWDATSSESVYFILVERVLTSGFDPADFLFSIDIIGR